MSGIHETDSTNGSVHSERTSRTWHRSTGRDGRRSSWKELTLLSLVEDELLEGRPPRALSHAELLSPWRNGRGLAVFPSVTPGPLQRYSRSHPCSWKTSEAPFGCQSPWGIHKHQTLKDFLRKLIFRAHTTTMTDDTTQLGPP